MREEIKIMQIFHKLIEYINAKVIRKY